MIGQFEEVYNNYSHLKLKLIIIDINVYWEECSQQGTPRPTIAVGPEFPQPEVGTKMPQ